MGLEKFEELLKVRQCWKLIHQSLSQYAVISNLTFTQISFYSWFGKTDKYQLLCRGQSHRPEI